MADWTWWEFACSIVGVVIALAGVGIGVLVLGERVYPFVKRWLQCRLDRHDGTTLEYLGHYKGARHSYDMYQCSRCLRYHMERWAYEPKRKSRRRNRHMGVLRRARWLRRLVSRFA